MFCVRRIADLHSNGLWSQAYKTNPKPHPKHKLATVERGSEVKDVEVHDMDHDGKPDVVVRTKHKFAVYFQESPDSWIEVKTDNAEREGMTIGDVDGDGDYDVVRMDSGWRIHDNLAETPGSAMISIQLGIRILQAAGRITALWPMSKI